MKVAYFQARGVMQLVSGIREAPASTDLFYTSYGLKRFMSARRITKRTIQIVLTAGFTLVILLLLAGGVSGLLNLRSIRLGAGSLVAEQRATMQLINEIERHQPLLSSITNHLSEQSKFELEKRAKGFREEAERFKQQQGKRSSTEAAQQHTDPMVAIFSKLILASYDRAKLAEGDIETHSKSLILQSALLFGGSTLLALVFTVLTVVTTGRLFGRMEQQANELSRVSWHMLDKQETVARRFSHEVHDELGQAMTALKANLVALDPTSGGAVQRREDCLRIVDEAIGNVRQLSHLLRPTILDDFGLDAALKWLAEGFTGRTGIQVEYDSSFNARLSEQTETHLFRIAQEALTNVARHSDAEHVSVKLMSDGDSITLYIADDGKGISETKSAADGLGMIGMRARARSLGGDLSVGNAPGKGVEINVRLPLTSVTHEPENSNLVSR